MTAPHAAAAKFYQEDIVRLVDQPDALGIVLRCWHDAEDLPPPTHHPDPLMRPLQRGEVGVSFFPTAAREILPEARCALVDRTFVCGDLAKRRVEDVRSAVVVDVDVRFRLRHVVSGEEVRGWRRLSELEWEVDMEVGDYVVCDNWIGQIAEMFDEATIEVSNHQLIKLPELRSGLTVGDRSKELLQPVMAGMQNLLQYFRGGSMPQPSNEDTVVDLKHTVLAVTWLAVNQSLDPAEIQNSQRPQRFWYGADLSRLTLVRSHIDQMVRVGDRLNLRPAPGLDLPVTRHGGDPPVEVRAFVVSDTDTTVTVLWQDGTLEKFKSTELIPYLNADEYDCWPGDAVFHKTEDGTRAAIVQRVNPAERTAVVRYFDAPPADAREELVSVLELDTRGSNDWSATIPTPPDGLGVHRGDIVFIHRAGTTNGIPKPRVPRIGELESWVRDMPVDSRGLVDGWRREMAVIGADIAQKRGTHGYEEGSVRRPSKDDSSLNWFGEVSDLLLDGTVKVLLPDESEVILPLDRLTRLYDGLEQLEDMMADEASEFGEGSEGETDEYWAQDENGVWRPAHDIDDKDEWEEADEDEDEPEDAMDVDGSDYEETEPVMDISPPLMDYTTESVTPRPSGEQALSSESAMEKSTAPDVPEDIAADGEESGEQPAEEDRDANWKKFELLPTTPVDHAFYASPPAQPSRNFLGRLTKEYRVLSSSLPDSIIVRAYEDRTDLLRSLIIGPENTPYEDAPFVIDWMLDSNFPNTPPIAHFHSWTNGNGRVNPNLYEEGKVCLSILGTWAGDKNEVWNPARSSLLQVLVSIQALVLVKEPWFCEPAYEKLRGTEEGMVNSRLYSEKAYVLSRGFVRRALEILPGSIESEIRWMYYTNGKLEKVLRDANALIEKSKTKLEDSSQDLAVPRLTSGGIITLERTLTKLKALLDSHHASL
ncbi:hypothetical protein GLOTRDRAFT_135189 [Gloeophyllum trabeum ATCC 11539]|uniref:UBC core domain-containing protein n=1 Tax=Gloeophyllum trabeum (strain ATCC 11539 / FP-39264 / Madison 617) TaxID=670483 RepID=S7QM96_GLOTA|nr:uncharacterized protein GLOTRDRAFT_135189 [Gloeophyllum trabeum ATCC 11539]EPQ60517.1 hypothetical protein GLOTRDRAFT_135189 [Gloeophyllum trabeum ATCC 11539]